MCHFISTPTTTDNTSHCPAVHDPCIPHQHNSLAKQHFKARLILHSSATSSHYADPQGPVYSPQIHIHHFQTQRRTAFLQVNMQRIICGERLAAAHHTVVVAPQVHTQVEQECRGTASHFLGINTVVRWWHHLIFASHHHACTALHSWQKLARCREILRE